MGVSLHVHRLIQVFFKGESKDRVLNDRIIGFVSAYAVDFLTAKMIDKPSEIENLSRIMVNFGCKVDNPAIAGWGFEVMHHATLLMMSAGLKPNLDRLTFHGRILGTGEWQRSGQKLLVNHSDKDNTNVSFPLSVPKQSYFQFDPTGSRLPEPIASRNAAGVSKSFCDCLLEGIVWLQPILWNQGCYDFVCIQVVASAPPQELAHIPQRHLKVITFQCTLQTKHSFKAKPIVTLLQCAIN